MSTQLISRPAVSAAARPDAQVQVRIDRPADQAARTAPAGRADFWLTDQQLSVADRNRALARYTRGSRSLMGL